MCSFCVLGAGYAKLVAQKSKGMPLISIPLTKLVGSAATEAMANLSLELFKAFNNVRYFLVEGCVLYCQVELLIYIVIFTGNTLLNSIFLGNSMLSPI